MPSTPHSSPRTHGLLWINWMRNVVARTRIKPDGGIIEVEDDTGNWRIVLVSEAKHQGKDIENISNGNLVGKNSDQDLVAAGNAIER